MQRRKAEKCIIGICFCNFYKCNSERLITWFRKSQR